jgi:hypothetical protein
MSKVICLKTWRELLCLPRYNKLYRRRLKWSLGKQILPTDNLLLLQWWRLSQETSMAIVN